MKQSSAASEVEDAKSDDKHTEEGKATSNGDQSHILLRKQVKIGLEPARKEERRKKKFQAKTTLTNEFNEVSPNQAFTSGIKNMLKMNYI